MGELNIATRTALHGPEGCPRRHL